MAWFPITDLSRADDIRQRRRRALLLLSSLVFVPWIVLGDHGTRTHRMDVRSPAAWLPRHVVITTGPDDRGRRPGETQSFAADTLRIDLPCASSVTVLPDPTLIGRAILSVPAGAQGALDSISIAGGAVTQRRGCTDDSAVTIRTSNVMPLTLVQSGENTLRADSFDGSVTIDSTGSGSVIVRHAGNLTVRDRHDGDVTVDSVTGTVTAILDGSGDLAVDHGTIPVLDATSNSSGDLSLDHAEVLGGRVLLNASGDLRLGSVSGTFEAETRGSGSVLIDRANADRLTLLGTGSGDLAVRSGHIATLDATRDGSGDLSIYARVENGRVGRHGTGDVHIPDGGALVRTGQ